jgi:bifunctional UDP-N-acetylglucosamine pyrophosphorylase/glucosamine-1-phosphate N-acetyltransferase
MRSVCAVVLAAGLGKRMHSSAPKVLHEVCWRPLVSLVRDALRDAGVERLVAVVPLEGDKVRAALGPDTVFVVQESQLGTAHAARCALPVLGDASAVLVLYGDTPLLSPATIRRLVSSHMDVPPGAQPWSLTLLTSDMADPSGYGRIVRAGPGGALLEIVEEIQCTPEQAAITEINTGIYCFHRRCLEQYLPKAPLRQPQGEYYLTDLPGLVIADGGRVQTLAAADPAEVVGINTRAQLAAAGETLRRREVARLMSSGVTVVDPACTYVAPGVPVGADSVIYPNCFLLPGTSIGRECVVGPGAYLDGGRIGDRVRVWFSTIEDSEVGSDCSIGPYAHLRPGSVLGDDVKVGNYAEVKNSNLARGTKVSHHSYVGDADVGAGVNVGAGAVFVNYDGLVKHRTEVADGGFIGCNVNLVAPLKLGERAYVACGSTVVKDVPGEALAIARGRQRNIPGWVRRRRAGTGRGDEGGKPGRQTGPGRQEPGTEETK